MQFFPWTEHGKVRVPENSRRNLLSGLTMIGWTNLDLCTDYCVYCVCGVVWSISVHSGMMRCRSMYQTYIYGVWNPHLRHKVDIRTSAPTLTWFQTSSSADPKPPRTCRTISTDLRLNLLSITKAVDFSVRHHTIARRMNTGDQQLYQKPPSWNRNNTANDVHLGTYA